MTMMLVTGLKPVGFQPTKRDHLTIVDRFGLRVEYHVLILFDANGRHSQFAPLVEASLFRKMGDGFYRD